MSGWYSPKTKNEIEIEGLWPDGDYEFRVLKAEERKSAKGNPMVVLELQLVNDHGHTRRITDYLMDIDGLRYKIYNSAQCLGLLEKYQNRTLLASDYLNRTGTLKLSTQKGKDGYPPKNSVRDYLLPGDSKHTPKQHDPLDDEIPF